MNILIIGRPGVGKTTLIKRLIDEVDVPKGGFYTEEIRDQSGQRVGFKAVIVDTKEEAVLSHIKIESRFRVGKYRVDIESFESLILEPFKKAISDKKLIIIDEIGKMEVFSDVFKNLVSLALNGYNIVVATAKSGSVTGFVDKIKKRPDITLLELSRDNFEELFKRLPGLING